MKVAPDNDDARNASLDLQRAIDALSKATDTLRNSGGEMAGAAGDYVRANPLKAAAAAAAAGLLLGLLLARRPERA
jgi:ElaB/YqjD/DUF883 family membrane-anchored ribosome-binding protein